VSLINNFANEENENFKNLHQSSNRYFSQIDKKLLTKANEKAETFITLLLTNRIVIQKAEEKLLASVGFMHFTFSAEVHV
jgi:hypothetical protein